MNSSDISYIYSLNTPITNLPKYIGCSVTPKRRLNDHISKSEHTRKGNWVKSLKKKGQKPTITILHICKKEEQGFWEQHYISLYKSWGFDLCNHNEGGLGGICPDLYTKEKIRKSNLKTWSQN